MRKVIYLILALLWAGFLHAQTTQVSGQVSDISEKKPLYNAIVSLLSKDSVLLKHTRTDAAGNFTISTEKPGPMLIMVSYPKFADFVDELNPAGTSLNLGKLT